MKYAYKLEKSKCTTSQIRRIVQNKKSIQVINLSCICRTADIWFVGSYPSLFYLDAIQLLTLRFPEL
jgi:hypothetical protein